MKNHFFSLPFYPAHPPAQHTPHTTRKRKRDDLRSEIAEDETDQATDTNDSSGYTVPAEASLPPSISRQYRVAGQPFDKDPPGGDFPHRSIGASKLYTSSDISDELHKLGLSSSKNSGAIITDLPQSSEKQRHLALCTAILHRCLLQHDFSRAGRVFGLLLRTELSGHQIDLRKSGLWSVGVEILLRNNSHLPEHRTLGENDHFHHGYDLSQETFTKVRQYLDRLIISFPHNRHHPDATSAQNFYPALYGIWVAAVQFQHTDALRQVGIHRRSDVSESSDDASDHDDEQRSTEVTIMVSTAEKVKEISRNLDQVISQHPYSEDVTLRDLSTSVKAWLTDLEPRALLESDYPTIPTHSQRGSPQYDT